MASRKPKSREEVPEFIRDILKLFSEGCIHFIPFGKPVFILKYPDEQLELFEEAIYGWSFHLEETPYYPLLRLLIEVFPTESEPFWIETFFDIAKDKQYLEIQAILEEEKLDLFFFRTDDSFHGHTETVMTQTEKDDLKSLFDKAVKTLKAIDPKDRDFTKAKLYFYENDTSF